MMETILLKISAATWMFVSVIRTLQTTAQLNLILFPRLTNNSKAVFTTLALALIVCLPLGATFILAGSTILIAPTAYRFFCRHLLQRRARQLLAEMLHRILVRVRLGVSVRTALVAESNETRSPLEKQILNLNDHVSFKQHDFISLNLPELGEWLRVFTVIQNQSHNQVEPLMMLEKKWKMQSEFRLKSGRAFAGIKTQSIVMWFLYIFVHIFLHCTRGHRGLEWLSALSMGFMIVGQSIIWLLPRSFKWTL